MTEAEGQRHERGAQHAALQIFVGVWNTEGEIVGASASAAGTMTATDSYEWLPGGFFLLHRVDARMGGEPGRSLEIIGYDADANGYVSRSYDDHGVVLDFRCSLEGRRWRITGETMRFDGEFNAEGTVLRGEWEQRGEDGTWTPWLRIRLTKAQ